MNESIEVRVVRLEEQLRFLVKDAEEAKVARKAQYTVLENMGRSIHTMATEVSDVKGKLEGQAPTIEEFITIKHKVVGAGKLGSWLWIAGSFIIGAVFTSREAIVGWLTR